MEKLLDDILEYSLIENKLSGEWNEIIEGKSILKIIVDLLDAPAEFTIGASKKFNETKFKRMPLQQILHNLIGNAIKHREKNNGIVKINVEESSTQYVFSVSDNGPGIEQRYHEKIFEMFQTLKPKDQLEGSGMGLPLVKKILQTAGGTSYLESEVGKGSRLYFTLPKMIPK